MYGKRFSPIDVQWMSPGPDAACCQCPDDFRERGEAVDYCPQHGDDPDFSLCHHDDAAGRRWRAEEGLPLTAPKVCPTCGEPGEWCGTGCPNLIESEPGEGGAA